MEGQFSYQDFDLLIEPGPPGSYRGPGSCVRRRDRVLVQFALRSRSQLTSYQSCATADSGRHWPVRRQLSGRG